MKSIYSEAKQHLSGCMLHDTDDASSPTFVINNNNNNNNNNNSSSSNNSINDNSSFIISSDTATSAAARTLTTTYDTSQRPFKSDRNRGRWSSAADFYFASTSHAFGSVVFSEIPVYALIFGGVYFLPAYLIAILLYAIPVFAIQTFLGQFSTSGAISAFRVSPIFKGLGYSILILNLTSLTYFAIIAGVPLVYAANSLHSVIPWMSCDNAWNTPNCSTHSMYDEEDEFQYPHATVEFFHSIIRSAEDHRGSFDFSWPVLCGMVGAWLVALGTLLKRVSFIGKFFRCTCIIMLSVFIAIFVNLIFEAKISWETFFSYFVPILPNSTQTFFGSIRAAIFMATWLLGPGWGNALTLASYNNFRRDGERLTYWVSGTHIILALMAMICGRIALDHFEDHVGMFHYHVEEDHYMQFLYLCFAYLFGSLSCLPNFWSFLFFGMLFLAELSALIVQMMSVLTAVFDEYEKLRSKKTTIKISLVLLLMTISLYFCTKQGFKHLHVLPTILILWHVIISLILLWMTTWIYGRERFQCDVQFMLGKTISNFKILLIRFVTPALLVVVLFQIIYFLEQDDPPSELVSIYLIVVFAVAPAYMIYKISQTTGTIRQRVKQCFAPHDWHPVDADNRKFYEEVMGTSEMLVIGSDQQFEQIEC